MPRFLRGMAFVPFLLVTWSSAAFIISYVVAVLSGHVNPFLPYIRLTATLARHETISFNDAMDSASQLMSEEHDLVPSDTPISLLVPKVMPFCRQIRAAVSWTPPSIPQEDNEVFGSHLVGCSFSVMSRSGLRGGSRRLGLPPQWEDAQESLAQAQQQQPGSPYACGTVERWQSWDSRGAGTCDTGTTPPESGIFGFMINFSAFLGAATMYTRYKIVEKQNQTSYFSTPVFNLVSLVLGLVGCIGMGIVANFQELAVPVVHDGGALLAFVCGVVYTLLQSIISYKSCPQWNTLSTCRVRMTISFISCAAVIPMITCASLISITKLEWNPQEKDYAYHVVSAICEWTVAFGFIFYFLTFIHDFQSVTLRISTELNNDI
ncbi:hypothetical protein QTO34_017919 [Cnephaeus nilssonii]|uniref:CWH43-like N-terminal domain-containing protein n=1 Tax=Cnephaeus nilssonii TaxID=3371016 RepID=A0AA40LQ93_CNENI|nr:hypothetical protein QTO34_017919 [Eptesicus nilssonii]